MRDYCKRGPAFRDGLLRIAVYHRVPVDLITIRRVLERHERILRRVLAFEETREERQALLGAFGCGWFFLVLH